MLRDGLLIKSPHGFVDPVHGEIFPHMGAGGGGHGGQQGAVAVNSSQKTRQRGNGLGGIRRRRGETGFRRDLRRRPADVKAADRAARRQRFQADIAETLVQRRMQQDMRLAESFQHVRIFWQRAEKFHARRDAGGGGGFFQFPPERAGVDDPQFRAGTFPGELRKGADGEMKALPVDMAADADGAERSRRRRGQRGKLRKVPFGERHLRQLLDPPGAESFQRGAAFARDADGDGGGARGVAQRGGVLAKIPCGVAHGFAGAVTQREFGNKFARRRLRRADRPPDERQTQFPQAAGRPVAAVGDVVDEVETDFPVEFADDAAEIFLP